MTSELGQLKARAAERRNRLCGVEEVDEVLVRMETMTSVSVITPEHAQAEADLDCAVEIAQQLERTQGTLAALVNKLDKERDRAQADLKELRTLENARLGKWVEMLAELDRARADVLACRDALLSHMPRFDIEHKVLVDTSSYEEFRT